MNFFGDGSVFDHAGIAVRSIEGAMGGLETIEDPVHKVRVAFITINGLKVELIEPVGEDSPVAKALAKGQHLYHLCYKVDDMDRALSAAIENDFYCVLRPAPAKAFDERRIAWVFNCAMGLFELLER